MLTTLCLFVYTLALSWFWIRKHGTGAFDGMGHLLLKGFLLVLPGTLLAFFAVYGLPGRLPLWFPSLLSLIHISWLWKPWTGRIFRSAVIRCPGRGRGTSGMSCHVRAILPGSGSFSAGPTSSRMICRR